MFLHLLSDDQRLLFVRAAQSLIHADEVVHQDETEVLRSVAREMNLHEIPDGIERIEDLTNELQRCAGTLQGRIILIELAGIALADRDLHVREIDWLTQAATALGTSADQLMRYCDFATRSLELAAEGRALLNEPLTHSA